ncbi:Unknown protein [Striga hermonthica]|uniref:Uncharacterized protein n=1 Tax=Striga hermonthica TaxID=68872 RepID=A0A9N7MWD5_STRHE|nr:Unknown protein [Striga hermonthica]
MRLPSACRPAVGVVRPQKGTCRGPSPRGGLAALGALKFNFHRAAGRILCRRLKYATGYCKRQSSLAATILHHWIRKIGYVVWIIYDVTELFRQQDFNRSQHVHI